MLEFQRDSCVEKIFCGPFILLMKLRTVKRWPENAHILSILFLASHE